MSDNNIIGINVANFITITLMAMIGMFVANFAIKAARAKMGQAA
jgi:hypothetical protein